MTDMAYRLIMVAALLATTACTQTMNAVRTADAVARPDDGSWPAVVSRARPDAAQEQRIAGILAKMSSGQS
jgi:hypothetical protein